MTKRCAQARFERRHARSFFSAGPQSGRSAFLPVWFTTRCVQRENATAASGHTTRPCTRAGAGAEGGFAIRTREAAGINEKPARAERGDDRSGNGGSRYRAEAGETGAVKAKAIDT